MLDGRTLAIGSALMRGSESLDCRPLSLEPVPMGGSEFSFDGRALVVELALMGGS